MTQSPIQFRRVFGAAIVAIAVFSGGVALAAPASATASDVCWFSIDTGQTQCFADEAALEAAVLAQTGTTLVLAPGAVTPLGRMTAATGVVTPAAVAATYIVATFYESASYGGGSVSITSASSSLCTSFNYTGNSMPTGWNDRVSSFHSYGTCKTRLARDANQGGTLYGPVANAASLGSMDDQASSYFITG